MNLPILEISCKFNGKSYKFTKQYAKHDNPEAEEANPIFNKTITSSCWEIVF